MFLNVTVDLSAQDSSSGKLVAVDFACRAELTQLGGDCWLERLWTCGTTSQRRTRLMRSPSYQDRWQDDGS